MTLRDVYILNLTTFTSQFCERWSCKIEDRKTPTEYEYFSRTWFYQKFISSIFKFDVTYVNVALFFFHLRFFPLAFFKVHKKKNKGKKRIRRWNICVEIQNLIICQFLNIYKRKHGMEEKKKDIVFSQHKKILSHSKIFLRILDISL